MSTDCSRAEARRRGGWEVRRAKFLFNETDRPVRPEDEVVTCFRDGQVTLRTNRRTDGFTNSLKEIGYHGVREGDLVIHNMDAFAGAVGVSESDGKMSPVCTICTPRSVGICVEFYAFYLRHLARTGYIKSLAKGIRERSTDFRWSDFKELWLPLPPLSEQKATVAYLDAKLEGIDKAIASEEKMIALLQERREIIINEAVGGWDFSHKELKERKGWEVRRLKNTTKGNVTDFIDGDWIESDVIESSGIRYLTTGNVGPGYYKEQGNGFISESTFAALNCTEVFPGDLLISRLNEPIGRTCIVPDLEHRIIVAVDNVIYRPDETMLNKKFIVYLMNSRTYTDYMNLIARGSTMHRISRTMLGNIEIHIPPLSEQEAIVARLDRETAKIDQAIETKRRQIALLRERREIIIDEAVTGKVKVP